jgi:hypothetical protein
MGNIDVSEGRNRGHFVLFTVKKRYTGDSVQKDVMKTHSLL